MTDGGPGSGDIRMRRGRGAIAASILAVLLIGGYFAAAPGDLGSLPTAYLINAAVLIVAFWFPARRVGSLPELRVDWLPLAVWFLAWTFVWDLLTAGVLAERELLEDWWVVYPAGVAFLGAILALHAAVSQRVEAPPAGERSTSPDR